MTESDPLGRLAHALARLPGVGRRSAQRMAFALVRNQGRLIRDLGAALKDAESRLATCSRCGAVTLKSEDPCRLCTDPRREAKVLCVVAEPMDVAILERAGAFRGRYHVLAGRVAPMDGEGADDIGLPVLLARLAAEGIEEVILALNFDVESDATCALIREAVAGRVKVSRLARGIPSGSGVAYADGETLARALAGRQSM